MQAVRCERCHSLLEYVSDNGHPEQKRIWYKCDNVDCNVEAYERTIIYEHNGNGTVVNDSLEQCEKVIV